MKITKKIANNLAKEFNINPATLEARIKRGLSLKEALETPIKNKNSKILLTYQGVSKSIKEWALEKDLNVNTIKFRLKEGWSLDRVFGESKLNKLICFNNKCLTLEAWAEDLNIAKKTLEARFNYGWDLEKCLETPLRTHKTLQFKGKTQTISQWSKELNLKCSTINSRLRKGWEIERVLSVK